MSASKIKSLLDASGRLHTPYVSHLRDRIDDPKSSASDRDSAERALRFFDAAPEPFSEMMTRRLGRVRESKVTPLKPEAPQQPGSHSGSESTHEIVTRLRAVVADPNATDEDTKLARRALLFYGETETPPR
jgi:hypothetical protein